MGGAGLGEHRPRRLVRPSGGLARRPGLLFAGSDRGGVAVADVIRCALDHQLVPITEVGKIDPKQQPSAIELAEQALQDLEWGARWVTVEARESGKGIGIYDDHGVIRAEAVAAICERMGSQVNRLLWEAPLKNQQAELIQRFGPNVNLGNIPPGEVLALDSLRAGLRFETFYRIAEELERRGEWKPEVIEEPEEGIR